MTFRNNSLLFSLFFLALFFFPIGTDQLNLPLFSLIFLITSIPFAFLTFNLILNRSAFHFSSVLSFILVLLIFFKAFNNIAVATTVDIEFIIRTIAPLLFPPIIVFCFREAFVRPHYIYLVALSVSVAQSLLCFLALCLAPSFGERLTVLSGYGSLATTTTIFSFAFFIFVLSSRPTTFGFNIFIPNAILCLIFLLPLVLYVVFLKSFALTFCLATLSPYLFIFSRRTIFARFIVVIACIFGMLLLFYFLLSNRLDEVLSATGPGRLDEAAAFWGLFLDHPMLGSSFADRVYFPSIFEGDLNTGTVVNPHNYVAFLFGRFGVVGALLTLCIVILQRQRFEPLPFLILGNICVFSTYWKLVALICFFYSLTSTAYVSPAFVVALLFSLHFSRLLSSNSPSGMNKIC